MFDIEMQHCPDCGGGELKIVAAILERRSYQTAEKLTALNGS